MRLKFFNEIDAVDERRGIGDDQRIVREGEVAEAIGAVENRLHLEHAVHAPFQEIHENRIFEDFQRGIIFADQLKTLRAWVGLLDILRQVVQIERMAMKAFRRSSTNLSLWMARW